ncbi:4Fe-4S dicluster domain-containing protein [Chloroflexota bacterium]
MQYFDKSGQKTYDADFFREVKEASRMNIERCYQCLTCSLGCPSAFAMDYMPNQLVRMVQLGLKEQVLASSTIWVCANCEACVTRCPNDVEIPRLMDVLREMALREKAVEKEKKSATFHRTFLGSIKQWGRQHELSMLLQLKLRTKDFFSDLDMGIKMLLKGKLKLLPPRFKDIKNLRAIFQRIDQRLAKGERT